MARKRMIDPEFWSDEEIGRWSHQARLFYIGLWNFADDEGRFKAHKSLLKSQIFPYDLKIDIERLKRELTCKIQWYEADGLQYGYIRNFLKYQRIDRPTDSKLPAPPEHIDEPSTNTRRTLEANIREVNIRENKLSEDDARIKFLDFVLLTDAEHKKLILDYGKSATKEYIERLNDYAKQFPPKFKKYASHCATIRNWMRKDNIKKLPQPVRSAPAQPEKPVDPKVMQEDIKKFNALVGKTTEKLGGEHAKGA